jgi:hypothetical protein
VFIGSFPGRIWRSLSLISLLPRRAKSKPQSGHGSTSSLASTCSPMPTSLVDWFYLRPIQSLAASRPTSRKFSPTAANGSA